VPSASSERSPRAEQPAAAGLLFDENLSHRVACALAPFGYEVIAVGMEGAPPRGSPDSALIDWCVERGYILVTADRGRKDRAIITALAARGADVLFVWAGITPRQQVELVVRQYEKIQREVEKARVGKQRLYRRRLLRPWVFSKVS
jgi:predicted nuclease of predicted toxin-antitoxin system